MCFCIVLLVRSIVLLSQEDKALAQKNSTLQKLKLSGNFRYSDGADFSPWQECNDTSKVEIIKNRNFEFIGNFTSDIEQGKEIIFCVPDLGIQFFVNGKELFSFAQKTQNRRFFTSGGFVFKSFISPGIKKADTVEIKIHCFYNDSLSWYFSSFLDKFYSGKSLELYNNFLEEKYVRRLLSFIIVIISLVYIVFSIVVNKFKNLTYSVGKLYFIGIGFMFCGLRLYLDYTYITLQNYYISLLSLADVLCNPVSIMFTSLYIASLVKKHSVFVNMVVALNFTYVLFILVAQNIFCLDIMMFFNYQIVVIAITMLVDLIILVINSIQNKNGTEALFLKSLTPLAFFAILDVLNYIWLKQFPALIITSIGYIIFLIVQFYLLVKYIKSLYDKARLLEKKQNDMLNNTIELLNKRIRPHFVYNVLNDISALCLLEPKRADASIIDFADYLRNSLDSLKDTIIIQFSEELSHINHYINLEKLGLGNKIIFEQSISSLNFLLPRFAVQGLIENSIRYIKYKDNGKGKIILSTTKVLGGVNVLLRVILDKQNVFITNVKDERIQQLENEEVNILTQRLKQIENTKFSLSVDSFGDKYYSIFIPISEDN